MTAPLLVLPLADGQSVRLWPAAAGMVLELVAAPSPASDVRRVVLTPEEVRQVAVATSDWYAPTGPELVPARAVPSGAGGFVVDWEGRT